MTFLKDFKEQRQQRGELRGIQSLPLGPHIGSDGFVLDLTHFRCLREGVHYTVITDISLTVPES